MSDLGKSFGKLIDSGWVNHKGYLLERLPNAFVWRGVRYKCLDDFDLYLTGLKERFIEGVNQLPANRLKK